MAILIRPISFSFNNETAETNKFQKKSKGKNTNVTNLANKEFNNLVQKLIDARINVSVLAEKETSIKKPDAVFSNNWVVYMPKRNHVYTMPMLTKNRKAEIDNRLVVAQGHFSFFEDFKGALEGTGSMVFDHMHKKIYAAISLRTNKETLTTFAEHVQYELICFDAADSNGNEIYHTNVLMAVGETWAVLCKEVISNRNEVISSLEKDGKEIIYITEEQMNNFCGNIFELRNSNNDLIIMMSTRAMRGFSKSQFESLFKHALVIPTPVNIIEEIGGGSVRCMITGSFM